MQIFLDNKQANFAQTPLLGGGPGRGVGVRLNHTTLDLGVGSELGGRPCWVHLKAMSVLLTREQCVPTGPLFEDAKTDPYERRFEQALESHHHMQSSRINTGQIPLGVSVYPFREDTVGDAVAFLKKKAADKAFPANATFSVAVTGWTAADGAPTYLVTLVGWKVGSRW